MSASSRPDIVVILTDEERAIPPYEPDELRAWRRARLAGRAWFDDHGTSFERHYTGSLACVPSRPTLFTGQYPDVHGVTQTDGLGKMANDSRMRWLRPGEVPTLGHWFRAGGYDTHYDGKWHMSHADLRDERTGARVATNTNDGSVIASGVRAYLDADPLDAFGFSGWVGPEPHGAELADCGLVRDPLIAGRVVAWLADRYRRRRTGDVDAQRPFLLVASFVNPHDIVLFPAWVRSNRVRPSQLDPPHVPPAPTEHEDLRFKPAAQIAYREAYYSAYGPGPAVAQIYRRNAQRHRDFYYRLHAEVDDSLDRVRRAVTEHGSDNAVLVRTSDHGDLLGAHGGLQQKWFNLYDECARVPFNIVGIGDRATSPTTITRTPTSHVDLIPSLLSAAGLDREELAASLEHSFTEFHPLPGRDLMELVHLGESRESARAVYLMTRDNMMEGDSGASGLARRLGLAGHAVGPLAISIAAHVASNFEAVVVRVDESEAVGGGGHLWKVVRSFDDPATWTDPGVAQLASTGLGGETYRTRSLAEQWELYDLDADPVEAVNRWTEASAAAVRRHMVVCLLDERTRCVPARNHPWPYAKRHPTGGPRSRRPLAPIRWICGAIQSLGLHLDDAEQFPERWRSGRSTWPTTNSSVSPQVGAAAFDFGTSQALADKMSEANAAAPDHPRRMDLMTPTTGARE